MNPLAVVVRTLCTVALAATAAAQLSVVSSIPSQNAVGVSPASPVTITFSSALDPTTLTPQNFRLSGRWSGPVPCLLSLAGNGDAVELLPLRPLFAAENATITVTASVAAFNGNLLSGGFMSNYWAAAMSSNGPLVLDHVIDFRLPGEGLIRTYGFSAGDFDGDGSPDISATNEVASDVRRMTNDGCGEFSGMTVTPLPPNSIPSTNESADFDGDGWLDWATGQQAGQSVAVFMNDGTGNMLPPTVIAAGGPVRGLAVVDADSDGDVDIVATNGSNVMLLANDGAGTFSTPTFFDAGTGERSIAVADANGDGKPDIFCGSDQSLDVSVLIGDGAGSFTLGSSQSCGCISWQIAAGDVDGDGNVDCVAADRTNAMAAVMLGDGIGGLLPVVGYPVGSFPISIDLGDLEGDGDLDIVVSSFLTSSATVWRNDGTGNFTNSSTLATSLAGSCAVIVDYNRDGATDVIVVDELDDKAFVYRHDVSNPVAVQPPTCDATLRINSFAGRGGFGSTAASFLPGRSLAFFQVSGAPGQLFALGMGNQLLSGGASPFGLLNLDPASIIQIPVNGLAGDPAGVLDAFGETTIPIWIPDGMPPGQTMTVQCLVTTPTGLVLSNPEQISF